VRGYFDEEGNPRIAVVVVGQRTSLTVDTCVDTMFDKALSLPVGAAIPLGLELSGEIQVELGDGSLKWELTYSGKAALGLEPPRSVQILLNQSDKVLIGSGLLQGHRLAIDYSRGTVEVRRSR
jgi:hypothetical protein